MYIVIASKKVENSLLIKEVKQGEIFTLQWGNSPYIAPCEGAIYQEYSPENTFRWYYFVPSEGEDFQVGPYMIWTNGKPILSPAK